MLNKVLLIGRLGKDPERFQSAVKFSIATTEKFIRDGENQEVTTWHNIVAFSKLGDTCMSYLSSGKLVYIEGKFSVNKKDDKTYYSVIATDVKFLSPKNDPDLKENQSAIFPSKKQIVVEDCDDIPF
jgi:single-strand DNA-binding protein